MNGETPGAAAALEMLKNIIILNENIVRSHELYQQLQETMDDLVGYHETYMRGIEILLEKSDEGKSKFSLSDVIHAMAEAADEVLGEPDDEPGPEDPLVGVDR
jgi:RNA processing factor Prp31